MHKALLALRRGGDVTCLLSRLLARCLGVNELQLLSDATNLALLETDWALTERAAGGER